MFGPSWASTAVSPRKTNARRIRTGSHDFFAISQKSHFCDRAFSEAAALSRKLFTPFQGRAELIFDKAGDVNLPSRNSFPVSCIARKSAGPSSKSVAKIFCTIVRVSSGTSWLRTTGEYPCSSASRAQYRVGESHDSAKKRLEYPENGGMG